MKIDFGGAVFCNSPFFFQACPGLPGQNGKKSILEEIRTMTKLERE